MPNQEQEPKKSDLFFYPFYFFAIIFGLIMFPLQILLNAFDNWYARKK